MVRKDKDQFLHLSQIDHYVRHGSYSDTVEESEKSGLRKAIKKFHLKGKCLLLIALSIQYK